MGLSKVTSPFDYKLVIVVRGDLDLSPGKLAAQVGHACVIAALDAKSKSPKWFSSWIKEGQKKVVVKVRDLTEMRDIQEMARRHKLVTSVVEDAGMTELPPGTVTCLGVGPGPNHIVDQVTGHLTLW